jgi:hypothetical protein
MAEIAVQGAGPARRPPTDGGRAHRDRRRARRSRISSCGLDETADPKLTEELSAAASELSTCVARHLDDEERNALPVIEEHLTQREWAAAVKRGAAFISVCNLRLGLVLGGLVLDAGSEEERRIILSGAPLPQRVVVQLFGARTAAAYRRQLHGTPN